MFITVCEVFLSRFISNIPPLHDSQCMYIIVALGCRLVVWCVTSCCLVTMAVTDVWGHFFCNSFPLFVCSKIQLVYRDIVSSFLYHRHIPVCISMSFPYDYLWISLIMFSSFVEQCRVFFIWYLEYFSSSFVLAIVRFCLIRNEAEVMCSNIQLEFYLH